MTDVHGAVTLILMKDRKTFPILLCHEQYQVWTDDPV